MYYRGNGVTRDYAEARRWYEKAANLGEDRAMNRLGLLYHYGRGVPRSYSEARYWYEKSAASRRQDGRSGGGGNYAPSAPRSGLAQLPPFRASHGRMLTNRQAAVR
jgi:uncharacterized protein